MHTMTTNWVLGDEYAGFPLMYHWRVLPDSPPEGFTDEFGGLEGAVAHWEGSPAVRDRLEAIGRSSFSLVVFLEHVPHTLAGWLADQRGTAVPDGGNGSPFPWVEEALMGGTAFMSSRGLVHFDAHFASILTDGHRLYFADFGLALSSRFNLSADESVLDGVRGDMEREVFLHDRIAGRRPGGIPPGITAVIDRHARPAVVVDSFFRRLLTESKQTAFPAAEIERQLGAGATIPSKP